MDYSNREELIRDHWRRFRGDWDFLKRGQLRIPVLSKIEPNVAPEASVVATRAFDVLEFTLESGRLDGCPAYRITCEGVVVEESLI